MTIAKPSERKVVLDTNFLLLPGRRTVDVFSMLEQEGFTVIILDTVYNELKGLSTGRSETAQAAKLALQLIKRKGLNTVPSSAAYADDAILAYCRDHQASAATEDGDLRRKLRRSSIPVVTFHRSGKMTTEESNVLQAQGTRSHKSPARSIR